MKNYSNILKSKYENPQNFRLLKNLPENQYNYILPTQTGRPEDGYYVTFGYQKVEQSISEITYFTNLKGPELGLLQATVELAQKRAWGNWNELSSKELDYYLRDQNSVPFTNDDDLSTDLPLQAIRSFANFLRVEFLSSKQYPVEELGPFANLPLDQKTKWIEKAMESFCKNTKIQKEQVSLVGINKLLVILRIMGVDNLENLLDDIQKYLARFFNESEINVIAD